MPQFFFPTMTEIETLLTGNPPSRKIIDIRSAKNFYQNHFQHANLIKLEGHQLLGLQQKSFFNIKILLSVSPAVSALIICFNATTQDNCKLIQDALTSLNDNDPLKTVYLFEWPLGDLTNSSCVSTHRLSIKPRLSRGPTFNLKLTMPTDAERRQKSLDQEEARRKINEFPLSEITSYLFLGNERDARNTSLLSSKDITRVLNITTNVDVIQDGVFYHRIKIGDVPNAPIKEHFLPAIQFIEQARVQGKKVLVHCNRGISRSATLVLIYLLYCQYRDGVPICYLDGQNLGSASAQVKNKRSIVDPKFFMVIFAFEKALKDLAASTKAKRDGVRDLQIQNYAQPTDDLTWLKEQLEPQKK